MPKYLYCSACGQELKQGRATAKGLIIDTVDPHDCDGFVNLNAEPDPAKPTVMDILKTLQPPTPPIREDLKTKEKEYKPSLNLADVRDKDKMVTSIAPPGLLSALQSQQNTPVNPDDLELDSDE